MSNWPIGAKLVNLSPNVWGSEVVGVMDYTRPHFASISGIITLKSCHVMLYVRTSFTCICAQTEHHSVLYTHGRCSFTLYNCFYLKMQRTIFWSWYAYKLSKSCVCAIIVLYWHGDACVYYLSTNEATLASRKTSKESRVWHFCSASLLSVEATPLFSYCQNAVHSHRRKWIGGLLKRALLG